MNKNIFFELIQSNNNSLDNIKQSANDLVALLNDVKQTDLVNNVINQTEQVITINNEILDNLSLSENKTMEKTISAKEILAQILKSNKRFSWIKNELPANFSKAELKQILVSNGYGKEYGIAVNNLKKVGLQEEDKKGDISMTIDQIVKNPDSVKKLADKKIDVELKEESDLGKESVDFEKLKEIQKHCRQCFNIIKGKINNPDQFLKMELRKVDKKKYRYKIYCFLPNKLVNDFIKLIDSKYNLGINYKPNISGTATINLYIPNSLVTKQENPNELKEESNRSLPKESGLLVTPMGKSFNSKIEKVVEMSDYYAEYIPSRNIWFFPEEESTIEALETELSDLFEENNISVKFESWLPMENQLQESDVDDALSQEGIDDIHDFSNEDPESGLEYDETYDDFFGTGYNLTNGDILTKDKENEKQLGINQKDINLRMAGIREKRELIAKTIEILKKKGSLKETSVRPENYSETLPDKKYVPFNVKSSDMLNFIGEHPGCTMKEIIKKCYGVTSSFANPNQDKLLKGGLMMLYKLEEKGLVEKVKDIKVGKATYTYFLPKDYEEFLQKKKDLNVGKIKMKESEDKTLSVSKIREIIASSGKTKIKDVISYFNSKYPEADMKVVREEAKDLFSNM